MFKPEFLFVDDFEVGAPVTRVYRYRGYIYEVFPAEPAAQQHARAIDRINRYIDGEGGPQP